MLVKRELKNVPEKKYMVNISKVKDVVKVTGIAQIKNMDCINLA